MQTIFELPSDVISQIAAGEVIERPAYVVKELIENALDAHALSIRIDISQAGFEKIIVSDNGVGMNPEDLLIAPKIHTTSKITSIDDLENIETLGFRGEALASIASVSQLSIATRDENHPVGSIWESTTKQLSPIGMSVGTKVTVEHLFANIPARQKFLKSKQTEKRFITDIVIAYALAHPEMQWHYTSESKCIFDLHPETLIDRYERLIGTTYSENLLPISVQDSYLKIAGYIGKPIASLSSNRGQYLYINNRPITDKLISTAIKEAYSTLLPKELFPSVILFFTVPTQLIDSNVHPRKEQVNFLNPTLLYEQVKAGVSQILLEHDLTFSDAGWTTPLMKTHASKLLKERVLPQKKKASQFNFETVTQWHLTYISLETDTGVLFFDQHAVDERILYERFSIEWRHQQEKRKYTSLSPIQEFALPAGDIHLLEGMKEYWSSLGFIFTFAKTKVCVHQTPSLLADRPIKDLVQEWIDSERDGFPIRSVDNLSSKMLAYLACRNAVKAGDFLTKERMKELIIVLQKTTNKYTCPHGRPTMIEMTKKDLDVLFKRE